MRRKPNQKPTENSVKRIAIYFRVSSLRQVNEGESLESQLKAIYRYIDNMKEVHGWKVELVTEFEEPGRSAKDIKGRKVLQQLMRD